MNNTIIERRINCPFCAESMTILLDLSAGNQSYIEDCQVCCQPMQVSFDVPGVPGRRPDAQFDIEDGIRLQVECGA